eukprot:5397730-Amphidinium_carterae.1
MQAQSISAHSNPCEDEDGGSGADVDDEDDDDDDDDDGQDDEDCDDDEEDNACKTATSRREDDLRAFCAPLRGKGTGKEVVNS